MGKKKTPMQQSKLQSNNYNNIKPTHKQHNFKALLATDIINPILMSVYFITVFLLLSLYYGDYMHKIEALSLFMGSSIYFDECMSVPGGFIYWLSAYLTQYLYNTWTGASIITLLLIIIALLMIGAFKIRGSKSILALLPVTLILLAFTNLGYMIFTLRPVGHALSLPLGCVLSISAFWIYRSIHGWILKSILIIAMTCIGYPLFGVYALLAVLMSSVYSLSDSSDRLLMRVIPAAIGIALIVVVPKLWFIHVGKNLMESLTYLSGLPYFYKNEGGWLATYAVIFLLMLIYAALTSSEHNLLYRLITKRSKVLVPAVWAIVLICVIVFRYDDKNFNLALQLDRAIWDQDWQQAIELAEKTDVEPTRLNTVLTYIALLRTGQSADRMFTLPYGWAEYNTTRDIRPIHDAGGALISYNLGFINYAYRWGMEYNIGCGMSVERLKLLTKCALLKYELPLAKKYLDILYNIPHHREWAKKYLKYVNNPIEIAVDPELSAIHKLSYQDFGFVNDKGGFESYIWPLFSSTPGGTQEFIDMSMQASLICRDLDSFITKIDPSRYLNSPIPRHYQEAALLWSLMGKKNCPVKIDKLTEVRHEDFLRAFRESTPLGAEAQREYMREKFGDTYWYYYIFTEDKPLI